MATRRDDDETSVALCGLTNTQISARHKALRGTNALKYPRCEHACMVLCGSDDNPITDRDGIVLHIVQHQCFLTKEHVGSHEFSSECKGE